MPFLMLVPLPEMPSFALCAGHLVILPNLAQMLPAPFPIFAPTWHCARLSFIIFFSAYLLGIYYVQEPFSVLRTQLGTSKTPFMPSQSHSLAGVTHL